MQVCAGSRRVANPIERCIVQRGPLLPWELVDSATGRYRKSRSFRMLGKLDEFYGVGWLTRGLSIPTVYRMAGKSHRPDGHKLSRRFRTGKLARDELNNAILGTGAALRNGGQP